MPDTLNDPIKSRLNIKLPTQIRSMLQYKNLIKQRTFTSHFTQLSQTILQPSRTACITNKLTVQWDTDIEWVWTKHKLKWIKSIQTRVLNALHVGIDKRDSVFMTQFFCTIDVLKMFIAFFFGSKHPAGGLAARVSKQRAWSQQLHNLDEGKWDSPWQQNGKFNAHTGLGLRWSIYIYICAHQLFGLSMICATDTMWDDVAKWCAVCVVLTCMLWTGITKRKKKKFCALLSMPNMVWMKWTTIVVTNARGTWRRVCSCEWIEWIEAVWHMIWQKHETSWRNRSVR